MEESKYVPPKDEIGNPETLIGWYHVLRDALGEGFEHDYGFSEEDLTISRCAEYEKIIQGTLDDEDPETVSKELFARVVKYMKLKNKAREILGEAFSDLKIDEDK